MRSRISRDEALMGTAELWAKRTTCIKPNGAVISKEGKIIAVGYNGSPPGHPHCIDIGCLEDKDGGCIRTVHAESNAIAMAAKFGISTYGSSIFCTSSPCFTCAKLIIVAGITTIVFRDKYRDPSGIELLKASHLEVIHFVR